MVCSLLHEYNILTVNSYEKLNWLINQPCVNMCYLTGWPANCDGIHKEKSHKVQFAYQTCAPSLLNIFYWLMTIANEMKVSFTASILFWMITMFVFVNEKTSILLLTIGILNSKF